MKRISDSIPLPLSSETSHLVRDFAWPVKRSFWHLRNFSPILACQLFCFSESINRPWRL